jgi:zinc protease
MIHFEKFVLDNGLRVLVHPDNSTPMAVVNVMYDVGARDENPEQTGFAHLFEHLMFGGSINIPEYDEPLQMAGGENNAYTTNDLTNYYIQLPVENLETALWLESDRMLSLAFSPESLEVQRKVVCEEFKEHYINKPYGDVWHHLRKLIYTKHPYQWMTIGKELKHVEDAKLDDVKAFFQKHYNPANAILVIAGPVTSEQVKPLVEKWFGSIPSGNKYHRQLPVEPEQTAARLLTIQAKVPATAFFKVWHTGGRLDANYHATDLITEILGGGASSRLYQGLVKEQRLFSSISCYHFGSIDPGVLVIEGKLVEGVHIDAADKAVMAEVERLLAEGVTENELQKVKNKTESLLAFEDMSLMNRANNLAFYELLGDANVMNTEFSKYEAVDVATLRTVAAAIFTSENCNTLHYMSMADN